MKAAILVEQRKPLAIADIRLPDTLEYGQVLVQVSYSGICGSQIGEIDGAKGPDRFLPHLLGHEGSGIVLDIGPGVTRVKKDDHVVMHWMKGAGIEAPTAKYAWEDKTVNAGWVTTFNSHAIISENRVTPIPADFDLRLAPLFGCAVTTAVGVVNNDAHIKMGQSVVVFGVGGVGLNVIQSADMVSAYPIIGVDLSDAKRDMALRFGATAYFNGKDIPNLDEEIRNIVRPDGADIVIDTTGNTSIIEQAYNLTRPDGKTILVGVPRKGQNVSLYTLPLHFKKILTGSHGGDIEPHLDIPRLIRLYRAGRLKLDGMITHEFPLERINEAIDVFRTGQAGRILVSMS
ncbi:MAG: S-(hydroxymethyl)glutathione dehydrogenase / alcohol dehydrogenase [Syntrophus sp. SKADARSKE-3]|nr:S-(hydroxymethyl)glutathione dehydrogenase / alcohol dehydrogenase [Syntrophus sp. SKADARSKE-3]